MSDTPSLIITASGEADRLARVKAFCQQFIAPICDRPRVLFGRNVYAKALIERLPIAAVVDDFTDATHFEGVPVVRSNAIPAKALVLALSGGRPLTVARALDALGVEHIDYFAFERHSGWPCHPIVFNEGFQDDFLRHEAAYQQVAQRLADTESRETFRKLLSFRLKADLALMSGFSYREPEQYFEPFLALRPQGEVFYDVGCFDGFTSREFIRHCPQYAAVHAFEPEKDNQDKCAQNFAGLKHVHLHGYGLSDRAARLNMASAGSGSALCEDGGLSIQVQKLDDVATDWAPPTFLKMDIEGAELMALEGARQTITRHRPTLAIAVYHQQPGMAPMREVPQLVLGMRDDYKLYLRHYTESIYETVMFFVPKDARP